MITLINPNENTAIFINGRKYDEETIILDKLILGGEYQKWAAISITGNGLISDSISIEVKILEIPGTFRLFLMKGISDPLKRLLILNEITNFEDTIFMVTDENLRRYRNGGNLTWKLEDAAEMYFIKQ